jgi:hypothetical protein
MTGIISGVDTGQPRKGVPMKKESMTDGICHADHKKLYEASV